MNDERERGEKNRIKKELLRNGKSTAEKSKAIHSNLSTAENSKARGKKMIVKKEKIPQQRVQGIAQQSTAIESKIRENAYRKRNTKKEDRVSVEKCIDKDIHY